MCDKIAFMSNNIRGIQNYRKRNVLNIFKNSIKSTVLFAYKKHR